MLAEFLSLDSRKNNVFFKMFSFYVGFWWRKLTKLEIKILLPLGQKKNKWLASQAPPHVCFYCRIDRFYIGGKKKCVRFRSFPKFFQVHCVSLLIAIIVSKVFMSKACMVVSNISCHCIWTNTDYYKQTKKVPPCLIKIFGNWPEKLIIFFAWP